MIVDGADAVGFCVGEYSSIVRWENNPDQVLPNVFITGPRNLDNTRVTKVVTHSTFL